MDRKIKNYPQRAVHLDFHTMPKVDDVGADFNGREFAQTLKQANVDSITVFAKCNLGFAYYPTKVGIQHPGLQCDLLGEMTKACHDEGIMVLAYFNAGLDHENALLHRDWCVLPSNGMVYREDKLNPFFRRMCLNTPYGDYLIEMLRETVDLYPLIDGFFFDCFNPSLACHGIECLKIMEEQGKDVMDENAARDVLIWSNNNFASRAKELVPEDKMLYFNGILFKEQLPYCSHLEIECLPQGPWGYDNFPANVRYTRQLGKHAIGQTGRFQGSWGDFGGIRTEEALKFDCYHAISNAVACGIGDHMHPRGRLDKEVYKIIGNVYEETKKLEPWSVNAEAIVEIGVLMPQNIIDYSASLEGDIDNPVAGAVRMLTELKYQVDVIDWDMDFSKYKTLVLPDKVRVPANHKDKLVAFIDAGCSVISSASAGLCLDGADFALPEKWGASCAGEDSFNISFFEPEAEMRKDIPDTPISIYKPGISISANDGAEILAYQWEPYFNKHWDGFHGYYYVPPKKKTERPVLIRNGNVFHFSFPIFGAYYDHAYVVYKKLVRNCLEKLIRDPLVKADDIPSFARVTLTGKDNKTMIHALSYVPELRGKKQIIEEPVVLKDVKISLNCEGDVPENVYLAPAKEKLDFKFDGSYVEIQIPEVKGYQMIVVEK